LAYSLDCIVTKSTAAPVSDWLSVSAWLDAMGDESGWNPNQAKDRRSSSPSRDSSRPSPPSSWNLLVAEDNLPDALLVQEAIRAENLPMEMHIATDGEAAINFITRAERDPEAPRPQCLLLDLNLPRANGFEVLERLRASEKFKAIPVIVMSSSDSAADRSRAAELGARYFRKTPSYDEFLKLGSILKETFETKGSC
jgi:two-component system, chemotaxis family, response regulator Rcp1